MKKGLIGVQMSTIAPAKMPSFDAFDAMKKLTDIGYHCIEISQVPMTPENVAGFRKSIDELGMNVSSCTASVAPMVPGMPGEYLNYHNHHVEFARYNGKYLLDIIKDNTKNLGFELDIHWIHRGGENPVEFIKKYAGRIRLLHLKDYRIGEMKMPEGGIDFTNRESIMKFMGGFNNVVQFAEVGEGTLPVAACIEAGLAGGSEYFLVEQDDTYGRDPFESLKISHDNLVKLGYGEWF